jgi:hypothetical protein
MDVGVLRENKVTPVNPRPGYVDGFALRIGQRATLLPAQRARAYGMLVALTHSELDGSMLVPGSSSTGRRLYWRGPSRASLSRRCVTTCGRRLCHTSAIQNMRHAFRASSANWVFHPNTSPPSLEAVGWTGRAELKAAIDGVFRPAVRPR